jgi:hypothetical protein
MSNPKRIGFFEECIHSLIGQTYKNIDIYLSISFENTDILKMFSFFINNSEEIKEYNKKRERFHVIIREEKTPQMRHFEMLCRGGGEAAPEWIFFCDDDDTYTNNRVEKFVERINSCLYELEHVKLPEHHLVGIYESSFGKTHREHRHEYWCYCVRFSLLNEFFEKLKEYPDVIENKCCDVLFAEYLRRSRGEKLFSAIAEEMYHYRRDETNNESITGWISAQQNTTVRRAAPPPIENIEIVDYIIEWNEYLYGNIGIYLHDTYLRTILGFKFDDILRNEFLADYPLLGYIDECHENKIRIYHERLRKACDILYDIPL